MKESPTMKKRVLMIGVAIASCLLPQQANAASFSGLYVFGDSLVDTGNTFTLTGGALPPAPYEAGRFTNGPIWLDVLSASLDVTPTPIAQVLLGGVTPTEGINFAFGGATTSTRNILDPLLPTPPGPIFLGLQEQIGLFSTLIPDGQSADADALYVIWAGANDYLPSLTDLTFQPETTPDVPVGNISAAISTLFAQGARNFLIPNLADLGRTPFILNNPAVPGFISLSETLNQRTEAFNLALFAELDELNGALPDINIVSLDADALFDQAIAGELGFTSIDTACFNQFSGTICSDPETSLFWDFNHPSAAAHKLVGELAISTLAAKHPPVSVPEPTAAFGILAFGLFGAGALKRTRDEKVTT
jgi:phospholipase/lecithinase/hemolysin